MQKADGFKTNKEVLYFSEDSKTRGEDEKQRIKMRNLESKPGQLLIP